MRYYSFSKYLKDKYGEKVHRISLDAGYTCPTKDGSIGYEGCIFCNEEGYSKYAGTKKSLIEQIDESISIGKGYGIKKFIAYFQNATNTYGEVKRLKDSYDVIRDYPDIVALYISTRPDCIDDDKLDLIKSYTDDYEVWIEYGLQSVHDKSLDLIKRGHSFKETKDAIERTADKGIKCGVHVMLGLPGESTEEMIATAKEIASLPVSGVKMHILHVLKGTELNIMYEQGKIDLLGRDEYVQIACDFLEHLPPDCVIFRLVSEANKDVLVAPKWINNKLPVLNDIERELEARNSSQGDKFRRFSHHC